jgi:thiol:disulfide interchange protein DsbD
LQKNLAKWRNFFGVLVSFAAMVGNGGVWRVVGAFVCLLGAWTAEGLAVPRQVNARHSTVELITAGERPDKDGGLWIGVRFRLEPGWHIYWKNPGDAGQPPSVSWQLPPGGRAADFEWPAPERIPLDMLVNYGYSRDVVLPVRLTLSREIASGAMRIGASLRWLICHDVCIPDKASLQLSLPLGDTERKQLPDWRKGIEEARNRVPRALPQSWEAGAVSRPEVFVVALKMDRPAPGRAVFFPADVGQINDSAPQEVIAVGRELKITLRKSDQLSSEPRVLRGVVAFPNGEAYAAEVPVGSDADLR